MNPILQEALGAIVRWLLMMAAGYLVKAGIWSATSAETYVATATLSLLVLGWSLWQKYKNRLKLVTALTMPAGNSESDVTARIASGLPLPSVTTDKFVIPRAVD